MMDREDVRTAAVDWRIISAPRRIALGLPAKSGLPTTDKPKKPKAAKK